jgi:hypothetical protein
MDLAQLVIESLDMAARTQTRNLRLWTDVAVPPMPGVVRAATGPDGRIYAVVGDNVSGRGRQPL